MAKLLLCGFPTGLAVTVALTAPASALRMDFSVEADEVHTFQLLPDGSETSTQEPLPEPVRFHLGWDLTEPPLGGVEDNWPDPQSPSGIRRTTTYLNTDTGAFETTPFSQDLMNNNAFGFTEFVVGNPWFGRSYIEEYVIYSEGVITRSLVSFSLVYSLVSPDPGALDEDVYHHFVRITGQNPVFAPTSLDAMGSWTSERFWEFLAHDDTIWLFVEQGLSQTFIGDEVTFNDSTTYVGSAVLIPEPSSLLLLGVGLAGLCAASRFGAMGGKRVQRPFLSGPSTGVTRSSSDLI